MGHTTDHHPLALERFERRLKELGVPVTVQRRTVYQAVLGTDEHPTADTVYGAVAARHPGISKATVYRTLDVLVRWGLISRVPHPGSSARYDANVGRHHHMVCTGCGRMDDVEHPELNQLTLPEGVGKGFAVNDVSVFFSGLCPDCVESGAGSGD